MRETLLAIGLFGLLAASAAAVQFLDWTFWVWAGVACIAIGLVIGVPAGVWYHVVLHRALAPRGVLPKHWIWNPTGQHKLLTEGERPGVLGWFYVAAASWSVSVLGCVFIGVATWLASKAG